MSDMPTGSYIPGNSMLHRMNPAAKLFCFLVLLAAVVMTDSVWGYGLMIGSVAVITVISGLGLGDVLRPVTGLWLFFVLIFLMNAVFYGTEQVLWSWWIFRISVDGMIQGANVILRVILLMMLGSVLTSVTSPIELTGAIEILLQPLRLFRVPVADVAMILSVALQFIPTFMEETEMIQKAQVARGARFESRRLRDKAASVMPLVVPVFLSAFRRADELSVAMEARGYGRAGGRKRRRMIPFGGRDIAALAVSWMICMAQMIL